MNTNTSPAQFESSFEVDIEVDEEQDPELYAYLSRIPEEERPAALIALIQRGVEYMRALTGVARHTS